MNKHIVATCTNGKEIYANLTQAPLGASVARNPHLLSLVKEIVTPLNLTLPAITIEQDMGRNIGYSDHLETQDKDVIFYAKLTQSPLYTKFVKNRRTDQTSYLTFKLRLDEDGNYELKDAWLGKLFPPFPVSEEASEQSKDYWDSHAIVFNGQSVLANTITKERPY